MSKRSPSSRVVGRLAKALGIDREELTRKVPPLRDCRREYIPSD